jgi:peptidyl-prolyl cis-trans isomerase B (cyclophilin B)
VATKKERQRDLARKAYERKLQRHADRDRRAKRLAAAIISAVLVVGVAFGSLFLAGAFSSKPAKHPTASASTPAITPTPTPTPSPTQSALVNGKCVYTRIGTASRKVSLPPAKPDLKATYRATIATSRGNIVIDLLNSKAPCTVGSFVSLASQRFYNTTSCHRLTTSLIYVLQCGDPTGTGTGGPGYQFYTENLAGATYGPGTVAMARAQDPASNGSQFFLVYKNSQLPPNYTPFGTIVSGLNIIQNVAKAGSDNSNGPGDGHPKEHVVIHSVTIKKT